MSGTVEIDTYKKQEEIKADPFTSFSQENEEDINSLELPFWKDKVWSEYSITNQ